MEIHKLWAGRVTGTNVGNVFLKLESDNDGLKGELRLNEHRVPGVIIYDVSGSFSDNSLSLSGDPKTQIEGYKFGAVIANLQLNERGDLVGEWQTTEHSAGVITLFPQASSTNGKFQELAEIPSFHSATHNFNSVFLDKIAIKEIGERLQKDFSNSDVVITVVNEASKSHFLRDFDKLDFDFEKAENVVLFAQEPETNGIIRSVRLDFGQNVNLATFQGSNESWVLGRLAVLKREVRKYERGSRGVLRKLNTNLSQLIILGGLIFMPSLSGLTARSLFMIGILSIVLVLSILSRKFLPNAVLYLGEKPVGFWQKHTPSIISWTMSIIGTLVAAALAGIFAKYGVPYFGSD